MSRSTRASSAAPLVALAACALAFTAVPARGASVLLRPQYRVAASIGPGTPQIEGTVEVAFTNHSRRTISDVVLWLFPNRFSVEDPWINDFYRQYVYPDLDFHPGGLRLGEVRDGGMPTTPVPVPVPGLPEGTAVRAAIAPLPPGGTRRLTIEFATTIPNRFGSFGEYEGEITAIGGWYPYLAPLGADGDWILDQPPPVADFDVSLAAAPGLEMVVNGRYVPPGAPPLHAVIPSVHYLSLVAAPRFLRATTTSGATQIVVLQRPPGLANRISPEPSQPDLLLESLRDLIELRPPAVPAPAQLVVVEAPLRLDLTAPGEGDVVISDRILKLAGVLRPLHELQLAQAVYAELLRPALTAREPPADYEWVSTGIANQLAQRFIDLVAPARRSVYQWIDLFNVLAVVDRFESTPKIPFVSAFFPRAKDADPVHTEIMTFNQSLPPGRVVMTKVRDQLGVPAFDPLLVHCLAAAVPFRACLAEHTDDPAIAERLDEWTAPYPAIDYRIDAARFDQPEGSEYRSTVAVRRVSSRPFPEPVTVRLRTIGGADADLQWKSPGDVAILSTTTPTRAYQAIIDPDRTLIDDDRSNNASPPRPQVVLDSADVQVSSTEFGVSALAVGRLRYDYRKDLALAAFYTNRGVGFTAGGRVHWGRPVDPTKYRHNLYAFYTFSHLDPSFKEDANGHGAQQKTPGNLGGFGFRYDYTNVFWGDNPSDQRRFRLYGDWFDPAVGADYGYADWGYVGSGTVPLWTHRTIAAAEVFNGFSDPYFKTVPNQGLYSLGGSLSIRGIGAETDLARNILVVRTELRHTLRDELDLNFLDLLVLRRLQMKLLVDAGNVSNSAGRIYDVGTWACGAGVGIVAMYDFLGFFSSSAYLDVATRVDEPSKAGDVQVLFGSTQEF
jgi:hypothetical protein